MSPAFKKKLKEGAISIVIGMLVFLLTSAAELLQSLDWGEVQQFSGAMVGAAWYALRAAL